MERRKKKKKKQTSHKEEKREQKGKTPEETVSKLLIQIIFSLLSINIWVREKKI